MTGAFFTPRFCGILQTHFCPVQALGLSHGSHRHPALPGAPFPQPCNAGSLKPWPCTQGMAAAVTSMALSHLLYLIPRQ